MRLTEGMVKYYRLTVDGMTNDWKATMHELFGDKPQFQPVLITAALTILVHPNAAAAMTATRNQNSQRVNTSCMFRISLTN